MQTHSFIVTSVSRDAAKVELAFSVISVIKVNEYGPHGINLNLDE